MSTHVQDAIVYLLVAGAVFYVTRMFWMSIKGDAGCGGCGTKGKEKGGCGASAKNVLAGGMSTHAGGESNGLIQISVNLKGESKRVS